MRLIQQMGRGSHLVKVDLKNAYRMVPIHPDEKPLLGVCWNGNVYVDHALPFGLCLAPKIFSAVADAVAWSLFIRGIKIQLHYLDDFLFFGRPQTVEVAHILDTVLGCLHQIGAPVALSKTEGPGTRVTFLGILIDTELMELRIPEDKLVRLKQLVTEWLDKRVCRRKELESFLGHLSHAASVVRPGRIFLRHLFSLLARTKQSHHHV